MQGWKTPQGPGWWQARDGLWYPPVAAQHMNVAPPPAAPAPAPTKPEGGGFFSKTLDWLKTLQGCATALAALAALGGGGAVVAANTGGSSSTSPPVAALSPPVPAIAAGIPSNELGTWSGDVYQSNGLTAPFTLALALSGTPGDTSPVGTFGSQTIGCQGNVFLTGIAGSEIKLRLETVTDPSGTCTHSAVADADLTADGTLDFVIISADGSQSFGNLIQ